MQHLCDDMVFKICEDDINIKLLLRKTSKIFNRIIFLNIEKNYINYFLYFCQKYNLDVHPNIITLFNDLSTSNTSCFCSRENPLVGSSKIITFVPLNKSLISSTCCLSPTERSLI